jgi:hypothetical protein
VYLAVFAAGLATLLPPLAAILPFLPPITRNVRFAWTANRLEFSVWGKNRPDAKVKSGKNGNVDHSS